MGIPEYEAKRYEGRVKEGGILLSVHCDSSDWVTRAKEILHNTGAEDVASAGESHADFAKHDRPISRAASSIENTGVRAVGSVERTGERLEEGVTGTTTRTTGSY
jgi:hypothetical protein